MLVHLSTLHEQQTKHDMKPRQNMKDFTAFPRDYNGNSQENAVNISSLLKLLQQNHNLLRFKLFLSNKSMKTTLKFLFEKSMRLMSFTATQCFYANVSLRKEWSRMLITALRSKMSQLPFGIPFSA